jgi:aspartyl/asparaginyl beta-hydroxylase (cupin superfamily)/predicted negative regulator of RcsB-dependent stress response
LSVNEELQLRGLIQQLEKARAAGQREEAQRLLARAESISGNHPLVLNARGIDLLQAGNAARARELFEQAAGFDPRNPSLWMNLSTALRALGQHDAEDKALTQVLALEPRHLLALLKKGELLALQGKPKAAAKVYQNALQTLAPNTRLPNFMADMVDKALEAVRRNDAAIERFIESRAGAVRTQFTEAELGRAEHGLAAFLGQRRIYHPQPTFLHVPKLPEDEFYPRKDFPWLAEFEAATAEIRAECERVLREDSANIVPYIDYPEGVPLDQWAELNKSRRWSAFFLWRDGERVDANADRCPKTAALLAGAPTANVPGYAPTAFFSILDRKSHIPPHCGVTNSRLIVHLPLVVPGQCRFRVGSETREWREGEAWVFDDTIEHEAWNESEVPRAILIFDTWHPALTRGERELIRAAVPAIKDYYRDEVEISGSE